MTADIASTPPSYAASAGVPRLHSTPGYAIPSAGISRTNGGGGRSRSRMLHSALITRRSTGDRNSEPCRSLFWVLGSWFVFPFLVRFSVPVRGLNGQPRTRTERRTPNPEPNREGEHEPRRLNTEPRTTVSQN